MKKWLKSAACLAAFLLLPLSLALAAAQEPCWRLDAPAEMGLPRSFRTSGDAFSGGELISREGLDWLRISGSGQPSEAGLSVLYDYIRELTMAPVYLLDLRQESHGFAGGNGVSWYSQHNMANRDKTAVQVKMGAVYEDSNERQAKSENAIFGEATPHGEFVATIRA